MFKFFKDPAWVPFMEQEFKTVRFDIGLDGLPYAVFKTNTYSYEYNDYVHGFGVDHFGNYENAVCLQNTIGL